MRSGQLDVSKKEAGNVAGPLIYLNGWLYPSPDLVLAQNFSLQVWRAKCVQGAAREVKGQTRTIPIVSTYELTGESTRTTNSK